MPMTAPISFCVLPCAASSTIFWRRSSRTLTGRDMRGIPFLCEPRLFLEPFGAGFHLVRVRARVLNPGMRSGIRRLDRFRPGPQRAAWIVRSQLVRADGEEVTTSTEGLRQRAPLPELALCPKCGIE